MTISGKPIWNWTEVKTEESSAGLVTAEAKQKFEENFGELLEALRRCFEDMRKVEDWEQHHLLIEGLVGLCTESNQEIGKLIEVRRKAKSN